MNDEEGFMDQLEMLWEYQKTDMAVDRLRKSLLNSPERKRLVQLKDKMKTQKALIEQIDEDISMMADRLDALQDAVKRNSDQTKILHGKIEKTQDQLAAITSLIGEVKRAQSVLNTYESEIKSIRSNTSEKEKEQIDSKKRFVKLRNEYEALKVVYDEAVQKCNEQLESMKATVDQKAEGISPELLERYRVIKLHTDPPLARLIGSQCGGCNMSLPSAVVRQVKNGQFIECETCGRLLIPV